MPMKFPENPTAAARRRFETRLWDASNTAPHGLGCHTCLDREVCGMLRLRGGFIDCTELCCGNPENCTTRMCRCSQKEFARRHMEIGGFELHPSPPAPILAAPDFSTVLPMIYHGGRRADSLDTEGVALKLSALYNRKGVPRFSSRDSLLGTFKLAPHTKLVVSGIDQDHRVERWWEISQTGRARVIENLKTLGVSLVTVPNFSVAVDWPRWSDLYSIKRIALAWQEFAAAGIPAALHPNGRTERDFERWRAFVTARPEIRYISYEFGTGSARAGRAEYHVSGLVRLAQEAGRPLHILVIGGQDHWPTLSAAFAGVTVIDTSIFMKTMFRQQAFSIGNRRVGFNSIVTEPGAPLDGLMADNLACIASSVTLRAAAPVERHG